MLASPGDRLFTTAHLQADLKDRSVRGGAATFFGQGVKFFLQLGSTMVLARILTPKDFGLIAMVAAVTGFVAVFKDLGLSMATVQRAEINHAQVSTLFWINVALSAALTLVTLALAPAVAWFYKDPRLLAVTAVLSTALLFGGLTVQHQALLRRQMRFVALVTIDICAMAAGIAVGVIGGLTGLGYWALVLMQLATPLTTAVGVWIASGWRPGWPVRRSGVRSMLAFGGYLTGFSVVNYFARDLDKLLLGRYWGAQPVGIYTRAYSLLLLPMGQITAPISAVAVPTLSRLQNEPERFRSYYLKAIKLIAYITMPLVAAMGVLSREIVELVLGRQWLDAGPVFAILAVAALLQPVGATVGWIYTSLGQTRRMFFWVCMAVPLIVLSFFLGLPWGAIGVASGYAVCNCILIVPGFVFALKYSPVTVRDVFSVIFRPLAVSIVTGLVMALARAQMVQLGSIATITFSLVAGAVTFWLLARAASPVWRDINDILATAQSVFARKE